jgi:aminopeptidase N
MRALILVLAAGGALAVCLSAPARGVSPFDLDSASGRLPKNVVPLSYTLVITPDVKARTFSGTEAVTLRFRAATGTVIFNSLNLKLSDVRLDGKQVQQVATDDQAQLTTLTLPASVPAGQHTLTLSYVGQIQSAPQGLYAQPYANADGTAGLLLSTQMEPSDARRMFPCWDEPAFRATYQLTAVLPAQWAAVSNMPVAKRVVQGSLATMTFERSPRMPSYLVELTAGELGVVSGQQDGVKLGVWAVRGHEAEGATALANAKQILADYNDYFGYKFPLPKLDSIAIPGGFSGAMENWGAITYTAQALLVGPSSSLGERQEVFSVQAHEMAHQWNGDLVTMGWWDDLWLNESFASWRAAKETDLRNPGWKWLEGQDADKEVAMRADSKASSEAIQQHVTDEVQAGTAFDPAITYNKGEAVLRMLEAYLGPRVFRDGIRSYMKARAFGNATTADLWNALSSQSHQDVAAIAAGWTEQPGFPLVAVAASCDGAGKRTLSFTQRRFLLSSNPVPEAQGAHWKIPLQIRSGPEATPQTVLLTQDGQTVGAGTCQEPLSINAAAVGFFRTQYDAATLALDTRAFSRLPDADRIVLLDDQWALVEAGKAPLGTYLALASGMGSNLDARAWEQIADSLGVIEYDERGSPGHDAFAAYARSILKPAAAQLGWDPGVGETPAAHSLRHTLIRELGSWGDVATLAEARRRFGALVRDPHAIAADDQPMVLAIVGRQADAGTFEQLHALAKQARDDAQKRRFYVALASVQDAQLAEQVAQIALGTEIPPQEIQLRFEMVGILQQGHPQLAWSAFSSHADTLLSPLGALAPLMLAQEVPEVFWNSLPADQLEAWLKVHLPAEMAPNIARGMEGARLRMHEKATLVPAADSYLAEADSRPPISR